MGPEITREAQYSDLLRMRDEGSLPSLGLMAGGTWVKDPKRLVFTLSRYKFVAKMLEGQRSVVEIGSADGFASRIVKQAVQELVAVDFDPLFIEYATATVDTSLITCPSSKITKGLDRPGSPDTAKTSRS